jgi:hypothetical protein
MNDRPRTGPLPIWTVWKNQVPVKIPSHLYDQKNERCFFPKTVAAKNDGQFDYVARHFSMERGLMEEYQGAAYMISDSI